MTDPEGSSPFMQYALEQIKASPFYDSETGTIDVKAAQEAHAKRMARPPADDPKVLEAIKRLKDAEPKSAENLEAMRNLGTVMGGAPDPEVDLFGWLSAVQPPPSRFGRMHYLDLLKERRDS